MGHPKKCPKKGGLVEIGGGSPEKRKCPKKGGLVEIGGGSPEKRKCPKKGGSYKTFVKERVGSLFFWSFLSIENAH